MKWVIIILLVLVVLVSIMLIVGYLLPVKHSAKVSANIPAPPDSVWQRISQPDKFSSWRKDIKNIQLISADEWIETSSHNDKIPFKIREAVPNHKLVTVINTRKLPFGGSWTYELRPNGNGTEITITEDGEVYNPLFRFMSKFIFGHTATMKSYMKNLETSF